MVKKQRTKDFRQEDWMDPLYLNQLLTEEEKEKKIAAIPRVLAKAEALKNEKTI